MVFIGCSPDITFAGISIIVYRLMPASRKVSIRLLSQQYAQCFSLLVIVSNGWVNWGNEAEIDQAFIELLNNVGLATMNDQGKTLLKSRIADDASTNMLGRIQKLPSETNAINKIPTNTPISVVNGV